MDLNPSIPSRVGEYVSGSLIAGTENIGGQLQSYAGEPQDHRSFDDVLDDNEMFIGSNEVDNEGNSLANVDNLVAGQPQNVVEEVGLEIQNEMLLEKKKGKRTSKIWDEFKEVVLVDGQRKVECIQDCKNKLALGNTGATTQFRRHFDRCTSRIHTLKKKKILHFQAKEGASSESLQVSSILSTNKYDHEKIREMIAHYILINEKPFSIVEEFGFNLVLKTMSPFFMKYSRATARNDVMQVYEKEKHKLKSALKQISKMSFTIDLWKSKNQRISYMVITAHYVDCNWKLQKRVLSFLHLPPPHSASEIADTFYKALCEWGVENKVFTISVDNAAHNDKAIKLLKDSFNIKKKLFFGGKLFHVRCCADILNLVVKDGIKSIEFIVEKIRDTVSFINASKARLLKFADVVHQLQLPARKLVMDCPTRWNSTYSMLVVALQVREAFASYSDREVTYVHCPTQDEWGKIEKVCDVLGFFNETTNIISGTEYPTSNLFLLQICTIKKVLDEGAISSDSFIFEMTKKMKEKFDKYWDECNLLMTFGAIMDPRLKLVVIEYAYPMIYSGEESTRNISSVKNSLYELYEEYCLCSEVEDENTSCGGIVSSSKGGSTSTQASGSEKYSGWYEFTSYVTSKTNKRPIKSDLDKYLEDGLEICPEGQHFDVITWWKNNHAKYRMLSRMAVDILAIPISIVASKSTFSAGERVVDTYRSKLGIEAAQALLCGSNWIRCHYGLKGRNKECEDDEEIEINLPLS